MRDVREKLTLHPIRACNLLIQTFEFSRASSEMHRLPALASEASQQRSERRHAQHPQRRSQNAAGLRVGDLDLYRVARQAHAGRRLDE